MCSPVALKSTRRQARLPASLIFNSTNRQTGLPQDNRASLLWFDCWKSHKRGIGLTKKAEPPPTRDVNRDSGTASANGGWLRRLVRWRRVHATTSGVMLHPNPLLLYGHRLWTYPTPLLVRSLVLPWLPNHQRRLNRRNKSHQPKKKRK